MLNNPYNFDLSKLPEQLEIDTVSYILNKTQKKILAYKKLITNFSNRCHINKVLWELKTGVLEQISAKISSMLSEDESLDCITEKKLINDSDYSQKKYILLFLKNGIPFAVVYDSTYNFSLQTDFDLKSGIKVEKIIMDTPCDICCSVTFCPLIRKDLNLGEENNE